ncbi:MAG: tRNA-dihydrouridine synthase family protein, partial [Candidatus Electrothrix sp. EH2]|nr:tRNA-dihydrouridine synthase family protein [Candidatus Electrothrix sp. EH2]
REIIATARRNTALPLTAKIRLGESFSEERLGNFCRMLEGEGIDLLTVHARLRKEAFCRKPHWEWVAKVKEWIDIPVIANGSVLSVADAKKCLSVSNADGLMIGRGAACAPWLFADIAREVYGADLPEVEICLPAAYADFVLALQRFPPERRLGRLKEFTHYFAKNYFFSHTLACEVQAAGSLEQAWQRASAFFQRNDEQGTAEAEQRLAEIAALLPVIGAGQDRLNHPR